MIKKLFSDILVYTLANIMHRLLIPFLSIIFAFSFSSELYGAWGIYISIVPLLIILIDFGLHKALGRFYFDNNKGDLEKHSKFISNILNIRIYSFIFLIGLCFILFNFLWQYIIPEQIPKFPFLHILLVYSGFEVFLLFILTYLRISLSFISYFILRFIQFLVAIFLAIIFSSFYGFTGGSISLVLSSGITVIITFFYFYFLSNKSIKLSYDKDYTKEIFNYSFPLLISDLSWWLRNTSVPIIISFYFPLSIAGDFHIAFIFASAYGMLIWCFSLALEPIYFNYRNLKINEIEKDNNIKFFTRIIVFFFSIITIFSAIIFSNILSNVFTNFSKTTGEIVLVLIYGSYFQLFSVLWFKPILFRKKTRIIPVITIFTGTLSLVLYIIFIPKYVLWASTIINGVCYIIVAISALLLARKIDSLGVEIKVYIPSIISVGTSILSYYLVLVDKMHISISLLIILICCLVIFISLIYRDYKRLILFIKNNYKLNNNV